MATTRQEKESQLKQLIADLSEAKGVVFAQYRGLTVKAIDKIRKNLRKENVKYQVVKVTLLKKAFEQLGVSTENFSYTGPIAVAFSLEDETTPARLIKTLNKEHQELILDGGILEKKVIGKQMVMQLADLPSKEQLLGQLLSVISGPARGLVTVLSGNMRQLVYALNAIAEAKK
ncbi:MAG: 50S ribosomal protein L10 [Candidatus Doudnabacteria bacterium]|nr:50S ribosomal protein L10 [Candidatus Doudnabacteria bacterium]